MMPGYQASYSETSCDSFFRFFFFNPTYLPNIYMYQETHSTLNERKGDGLIAVSF